MSTIKQGANKCVLSLRVARALIGQGYQVVDVGTSHRFPGRVVIKFDNTPELNAALDEIRRDIRAERQGEMSTD
ncbi:hypothetical protein [Sporosarcina highlanderae]|uniref:DUF5659 domain-containing protein n=1 Tax=Sporosarcina highlanderae TaxID=3035916 RepID=A0ABT8JUU9_9BACL|nr:hypothetical protein [Sporosarcina highlanderae]MDN4608632.1 hypothetical protein [Sporosarcina highlanderae]